MLSISDDRKQPQTAHTIHSDPDLQMATTPIDVALSHSFGFEVLGDALGPGDVLTDAATRGLGVTASTAKRTASPGTLPTGTLPVLNQSSGEAADGQC